MAGRQNTWATAGRPVVAGNTVPGGSTGPSGLSKRATSGAGDSSAASRRHNAACQASSSMDGPGSKACWPADQAASQCGR